MNYEDSLLDQQICNEIDEVLASPELDLQDKILEAERLQRAEWRERMSDPDTCPKCGSISCAHSWEMEPQVNDTVALLKNLEQLTQRLHKNLRQDCINLALSDVVELKELLNRAICEELEK